MCVLCACARTYLCVWGGEWGRGRGMRACVCACACMCVCVCVLA